MSQIIRVEYQEVAQYYTKFLLFLCSRIGDETIFTDRILLVFQYVLPCRSVLFVDFFFIFFIFFGMPGGEE